jgi:hypothetical protein
MVRSCSYNTSTLVLLMLLIRAQKSVMDLFYLLLAAFKAAPTTLCSSNSEHSPNQTNLTRASAQPTTCTSGTMNSADQIATENDEVWRRIQPLVNQARWCLTQNFDEKSNYNTLFRQSKPDRAPREWRISAALYRIRGKSTYRRQYICCTCP